MFPAEMLSTFFLCWRDFLCCWRGWVGEFQRKKRHAPPSTSLQHWTQQQKFTVQKKTFTAWRCRHAWPPSEERCEHKQHSSPLGFCNPPLFFRMPKCEAGTLLKGIHGDAITDHGGTHKSVRATHTFFEFTCFSMDYSHMSCRGTTLPVSLRISEQASRYAARTSTNKIRNGNHRRAKEVSVSELYAYPYHEKPPSFFGPAVFAPFPAYTPCYQNLPIRHLPTERKKLSGRTPQHNRERYPNQRRATKTVRAAYLIREQTLPCGGCSVHFAVLRPSPSNLFETHLPTE